MEGYKKCNDYNYKNPAKELRKTAIPVCHKLCGNLLLNDQVSSLEIWKKRINASVIVSISVFNSTLSTGSIWILMGQNDKDRVEFTVPVGNTLSATVDHIDSITVFQINKGRIEGNFCLDICCLPFD
ncbi:hypothetical protein COE58_03530 [Bacillus cereus]|uniref:S-Ena type endospore appendage n=1 Tax=Bacillus cereus group TaxID=86661 RepID=UPI0002F3DDE7|nr:S-Ena type endospore appendage [Bacillus cereus]PGZ63672.1 hypothetical protein COE58_03530 [Bacillus cereus]HDR4563111.1 hypothetical protein [Bacillus luti]